MFFLVDNNFLVCAVFFTQLFLKGLLDCVLPDLFFSGQYVVRDAVG